MERPVIDVICAAKGWTNVQLQAEPRVELAPGIVATGHIDVLAEHDQRIAGEVKCPSSFSFRKIKENGCPRHYVIQASWYAMIADADHGEIFVWSCDDWDYLTFTVPRSERLESIMRRKAVEFGRCVLEGRRPDNWEAEDEDVEPIGQTVVEANKEMSRIMYALREAEKAKKGTESVCSDLKQRILDLWPADAKRVRSPYGSASMSEGRESISWDMDRIRMKHPEISWDDYRKVSRGKRFLSFRASGEEE